MSNLLAVLKGMPSLGLIELCSDVCERLSYGCLYRCWYVLSGGGGDGKSGSTVVVDSACVHGRHVVADACLD